MAKTRQTESTPEAHIIGWESLKGLAATLVQYYHSSDYKDLGFLGKIKTQCKHFSPCNLRHVNASIAMTAYMKLKLVNMSSLKTKRNLVPASVNVIADVVNARTGIPCGCSPIIMMSGKGILTSLSKHQNTIRYLLPGWILHATLESFIMGKK